MSDEQPQDNPAETPESKPRQRKSRSAAKPAAKRARTKAAADTPAKQAPKRQAKTGSVGLVGVTIDVGGTVLTMSFDEAEAVFATLNKIFGRN